MFTTIMYGVINEITRQPGSAEIPLPGSRTRTPKRPAARSQRAPRPHASAPRAELAGRYRVLADSFKRAAGFY